MPAKVWEDEDFRPIGVVMEGGPLEVVSIDERVERWESLRKADS
jgi:hypothetical protein